MSRGTSGIPGAPGRASSNGSGSSAGLPAGRDVSGQPGTAGGDYSLDKLPGSSADGASGPMTAQERAAVLAGTLDAGYEDFDGFILEERARAQAQANATRGLGGTGGSNGVGQAGGPAGPVISSGRNTGSGVGATGIPGSNANSSNTQVSFPAPEDIPTGRDDDVVARQLREAAMKEPDPELREKLWDEYRKYTGIKE